MKAQHGEITAKHIDAVLALAERGENGKLLPLPGGIEVRRERDALVFRQREKSVRGGVDATDSKEFAYAVVEAKLASGDCFLDVAELGCSFRFKLIDWQGHRGETSKEGAVLDRAKLVSPLVLRSWRPGDRIQLVGHRTARKLKRLLNEKHVSRWDKDGWPVLCSNGIVAWARGLPVAGAFAASSGTRAGIVIVEEPLT